MKKERLTQEDFDHKMIFLLKACNYFALMSYDISFELNQLIKRYNKEQNHRYVLSNKLKKKVKQMEDARKIMSHHAQGVTDELVKCFEELEVNGEVKALTMFLETTDTFESILEMFSLCLLQCNENPEELKKLYHSLKRKVRLSPKQKAAYKEPDWEALGLA